MKNLLNYWTLVREVALCLVATILFPVLMFQQGWSGKFVPRDHEKNAGD